MNAWRRLRRGAPLYACLVLVGMGMTFVVQDHFRRGCGLIGGALLTAAALRLILNDHAAGYLRVRAKWIDVLIPAVLGLALVAVALIVPAGPS